MKFIISIALCLIVSSCAVFVDSNVREVQSGKRLKLPISMTAKFQTHLGMKYASYNQRDVSLARSSKNCLDHNAGESRDLYLMSVLCNSYFFLNQKHPVTQFAKSDKEMIEFSYRLNEKHGVVDSIWTWSNLLTGTIIPYRGKRDFQLVVSVYKNSKVVKRYEFSDYFIEWRNLFLLPAAPFIDGYQVGTGKVVKSLMSQAVRKLREDKFL